MSPRFHLPKWQQKHRMCHKSAEHSSADLGRRRCNHLRVGDPMQQLHQTTRQKRALLQLSLAAAQQQQCCRRRAAQPVEETRLVQKDVRQGLPASGNVAQKTLVQRSSRQRCCHTARPLWFYSVHLARPLEGLWNCQPDRQRWASP